MLQPIIQASQLLQARKLDGDVDSVCDMCNRMSANQVQICGVKSFLLLAFNSNRNKMKMYFRLLSY